MTPLTYPAAITEDEPGEFLVRFRDVPEALTSGDTRLDAEAQAADALQCALGGYLLADRMPPRPTAALQGEAQIALAPSTAACALLVWEMDTQQVSERALAQLLGREEKTVRRVLRGKSPRIEFTLSALQALGIRPALAL